MRYILPSLQYVPLREYFSGKEARHGTTRQITRLVPRAHERPSQPDEHRVKAVSIESKDLYRCHVLSHHLASTHRGHRFHTYISLALPSIAASGHSSTYLLVHRLLGPAPVQHAFICCCWSSATRASYLRLRRIFSPWSIPLLRGIYLLHLSGGGTRWYAPVLLALDSRDHRCDFVVH